MTKHRSAVLIALCLAAGCNCGTPASATDGGELDDSGTLLPDGGKVPFCGMVKDIEMATPHLVTALPMDPKIQSHPHLVWNQGRFQVALYAPAGLQTPAGSISKLGIVGISLDGGVEYVRSIDTFRPVPGVTQAVLVDNSTIFAGIVERNARLGSILLDAGTNSNSAVVFGMSDGGIADWGDFAFEAPNFYVTGPLGAVAVPSGGSVLFGYQGAGRLLERRSPVGDLLWRIGVSSLGLQVEVTSGSLWTLEETTSKDRVVLQQRSWDDGGIEKTIPVDAVRRENSFRARPGGGFLVTSRNSDAGTLTIQALELDGGTVWTSNSEWPKTFNLIGVEPVGLGAVAVWHGDSNIDSFSVGPDGGTIINRCSVDGLVIRRFGSDGAVVSTRGWEMYSVSNMSFPLVGPDGTVYLAGFSSNADFGGGKLKVMSLWLAGFAP